MGPGGGRAWYEYRQRDRSCEAKREPLEANLGSGRGFTVRSLQYRWKRICRACHWLATCCSPISTGPDGRRWGFKYFLSALEAEAEAWVCGMESWVPRGGVTADNLHP